METPTPHTPTSEELDALAREEAAEVEDFDAWREQQKAKRGRGRRVRIFGQLVDLPSSMPLGLSISMDTLSESSDLADVQEVVGALYGRDALDHWIAEGVDLFEFQVLMAWGIAGASGKRLTFDEAADLVVEAEKKKAATPGKAKKRKGKKRGPGGGSPATGR